METVKLTYSDGRFYTPCIICGESVDVYIGDSHAKICTDCKDAIKHLKGMLKKVDHSILKDQLDFDGE